MFWLAGSLLIIGLASVVNPTIGWRWLIRIASIPGIILILVFKVGRTSLPVHHCTTADLACPQAPRDITLTVSAKHVCPRSTHSSEIPTSDMRTVLFL